MKEKKLSSSIKDILMGAGETLLLFMQEHIHGSTNADPENNKNGGNWQLDRFTRLQIDQVKLTYKNE